MMEMETKNNQSFVLVVTAAGSSNRMGGSVKKEFLRLSSGLSVLAAAVEPFIKTLPLDACVITYRMHDQSARDETREALYTSPFLKDIFTHNQVPLIFAEGGRNRQESVYHGLRAVMTHADIAAVADNVIVLIHDGARPFISPQVITATAEGAKIYGAAVPALTPTDTQKEIDSCGKIVRHLVRSTLAAVQTPQAFMLAPLIDAHCRAADSGKVYTDDTEIWSDYISPVYTVPGDVRNIKITYPKDIQEQTAMIRIGFGYDLHRLVVGRKLILGGVTIPFEKGEDGHSDGDVLLHAVADALLGAAGLGDIGSYFPPSDMRWKDADSAELLNVVWKSVSKAGWSLANLDCVVALEQPKFLPYRHQVCESIAKILDVSAEQIFVKAKTGEKIGKIGRGEAVEAYASCLLVKNSI